MAFLALTLVFCIVILRLSKCEHANPSLENICTSICLEEDLLIHQQKSCNEKCKRARIKRSEQHLEMELVCRDDTTLVVGIDSGETNEIYEKVTESQNFMLQIQREDKAHLPSQTVVLFNTTFVKLENLTANTAYNVSTTLLSSRYSYVEEEIFVEFQTLETNYVPGNVTNIYVEEFLPSEDGKGLNAVVLWDPSPDQTCSYDLLFHSKNDETFHHREFNQPEELYRHELKDLTFGMEYAIGVRAINTKNRGLQSSIWWHVVKTPSCLDWFVNNLNRCAPYQPANVTVETDFIVRDHYKLNVSWDNPPQQPNYYTIDIINYESTLRQTFNFTATVTNSIQFDDVKILGIYFELIVTAHSNGGKSSTIYRGKLESFVHQQLVDEFFNLQTVFLIGVPLLTIVTVTLVLLKLKWQRTQNGEKYHLEMKYLDERINENEICKEHHSRDICAIQFDFNMNDAMEISPDLINVFEIIGEGAFGCVRRATLMLDEQHVAVKMLKSGPSVADIKNFCREIQVMKSVPKHPHIVGIIGHCTKNIFQLMLLTEYCSEGNLLDFLRKIWKQQSKQTDGKLFCSSGASTKCNFSDSNFDTSLTEKYPITYQKLHGCFLCPAIEYPESETNEKSFVTTISTSSPILIVENSGYGYDIDNTSSPLTQTDLISFAYQVANGMNFLSLNKVVHRDLACRNVLVCEDRATVKISDFGLSRDIYQDNLYKRSGSGMLPIKWMAIESLTHQVYTSQSDVWSFGVLLYEIITGGSVPYPSMETREILNFLKGGGRMERPDECRSDIYELMQICWNDVPSERPTFKIIEEKLVAILNEINLTQI